jgi:SAM-dependent methyltransferase
MKLNIGCGLKRPEGFINVDADPDVKPDVLCDLARDRWPFEDNSMAEGICSHVMEHVGPGFFHFLQEMYRVSAPGCRIKVAVPHPRSDLFLRDPTHVRPILPDMMIMFSKRQLASEAKRGVLLTPFAHKLGVDFYIDKAFYVLNPNMSPALKQSIQSRFQEFEQHYNNVVWEIQFEMEAIKE